MAITFDKFGKSPTEFIIWRYGSEPVVAGRSRLGERPNLGVGPGKPCERHEFVALLGGDTRHPASQQSGGKGIPLPRKVFLQLLHQESQTAAAGPLQKKNIRCPAHRSQPADQHLLQTIAISWKRLLPPTFRLGHGFANGLIGPPTTTWSQRQVTYDAGQSG